MLTLQRLLGVHLSFKPKIQNLPASEKKSIYLTDITNRHIVRNTFVTFYMRTFQYDICNIF